MVSPSCYDPPLACDPGLAGRPVRRADLAAGETRAETAAPSRAAATPARRRLSFNQKHALATLPDVIARLGEKVRALQTGLADPALYARDRPTFEQISAALTAAQSELAAAEDKWLELEMLREEIDRQ